ncbi:MAG: FkbM family methyltransferase [Cyanophyceae cyanobacterium]
MTRQGTIQHDGQTHNLFLHPQGEFISDLVYFRSEFFERTTLEFCRQNFDLSYVLDIGANIGNHSYFFSEICGSKVIAIEPIPENFNLLSANCPQAFSLNLALSDQVKTVNMAKIAECLGNCMIVEDEAIRSGQFTVGQDCGHGTVEKLLSIPAIPLDLLNLQKLTFIKLDVEGVELEVLAGARETLQAFSGVLMVEIHPNDGPFEKLARGRYTRQELLNAILDLGFQCFHTDAYSNHFFAKPKVAVF